MRPMRVLLPELRGWPALDQLSTMREEINRLFDASFGEFPRASDLFSGWSPALDLYEDKETLIVRIELPGMKKEDIDISFQDGALTVSGERKPTEAKDDVEVFRNERFFGRFHRTITLPKPVISDKASASYKDGILTIRLPKTEEARPRQIEVKVG